MRKVLLADASEQWRELLTRAMEHEYQVRSCPDGNQVLELVEQFEPDVLVMDLMLQGTDGLSVLKDLEGRSFRPRIIITGRYFSNFITTSLERYQVDFIILKPCTARSITDRVTEVLELEQSEPVTTQEPFDHITAMLVSLGAPSSQQGFRFLRSGILLLMEEPGQQLTKSLYPAIAREHNTNAANVEKGIRTTIMTAWARRRDDTWRIYFPVTTAGQIPRPTSGQFLSRLADAALSAVRKQA